ncbi:MAG TPA: hypothetical protein VJN29_00945 [Intrasporangium sp.]|uniref:hypothetical protein n=1 Tax=Intrasporangium sp. TaxID=1925024 RepID=UPI002B48CCE3|nr:hypothetical protein [Intrasporangium sp.]HKX65765.1 hypothetical protein [Intrasporangium sp.]
MADRSRERAADESAVTPYHALLSLHIHARSVDVERMPGYRPVSLPEALVVVAMASTDEIPHSARLAVLYELAKADYPERGDNDDAYLRLADSVAPDRRSLEARALLERVKQLADAGEGVAPALRSAGLLGREAAFISESVCETKEVRIGGLSATWIYSEFETDADFGDLARWLDPRQWDDWGPLFFKEMSLVETSEPIPLGRPGDPHWHGLFREVVQLPLRQITTLLHCNYWQDGDRAAGMTYDLSLSLDNQLDVDRGFILANKLDDDLCSVRVLKIVSFTNFLWDQVAEWVCPFWTDWVRAAVQGGDKGDPKEGGPATLPGLPMLTESLRQCIDDFSESAEAYVEFIEDVTSRVSSREYTTSDLLEDGRLYWSQLAQDWSRAWLHGFQALDAFGREGLRSTSGPAGNRPDDGSGENRARRAAATGAAGASAATGAAGGLGAAAPVAREGLDSTLVRVPGLAAGARPTASDFVSIEAGGARIPASSLVLNVESLGGNEYGVRLRSAEASASAGLYIGQLAITGGPQGIPAQLYVSGAVGA